MEARASASSFPLHPEVIATFPDAWPSGIAASRSGRLFVSFPRVDAPPTAINVGEWRDGRLVPYPDELVNAVDPSDAEHRFTNVHGIAMGPGNRLLLLDSGAQSFGACDPARAKLWIVDLDRDAIVHGIGFAHGAVLPTSYLNDLVIDYRRGEAGIAYITDSGSAGPNGIVVVDLDSGRSWRRLSGTDVVRPAEESAFALASEAGPVKAAPGCDGIALSPDGATLWWTPLGGYALFSVDTDLLVDPHADDHVVLRHVTRHTQRDFASDGLDCDREGRLYLTDVVNGKIKRYIPGEERYETLLGDATFRWPDAVRLGPDRAIYVTDSQLDRAPMFRDGADLRERPYRLYRAAIDADPAQY